MEAYACPIRERLRGSLQLLPRLQPYWPSCASGGARDVTLRAACLLTAKPKSLPLDPNHLRLFGQKTIGDRGFERLADGFFMRRMGDQNDRHRAARINFGAGAVAVHDAF